MKRAYEDNNNPRSRKIRKVDSVNMKQCPTANLQNIPIETLTEILSRAGGIDLMSVSLASKYFRKLYVDDTFCLSAYAIFLRLTHDPLTTKSALLEAMPLASKFLTSKNIRMNNDNLRLIAFFRSIQPDYSLKMDWLSYLSRMEIDQRLFFIDSLQEGLKIASEPRNDYTVYFTRHSDNYTSLLISQLDIQFAKHVGILIFLAGPAHMALQLLLQTKNIFYAFDQVVYRNFWAVSSQNIPQIKDRCIDLMVTLSTVLLLVLRGDFDTVPKANFVAKDFTRAISKPLELFEIPLLEISDITKLDSEPYNVDSKLAIISLAVQFLGKPLVENKIAVDTLIRHALNATQLHDVMVLAEQYFCIAKIQVSFPGLKALADNVSRNNTKFKEIIEISRVIDLVCSDGKCLPIEAPLGMHYLSESVNLYANCDESIHEKIWNNCQSNDISILEIRRLAQHMFWDKHYPNNMMDYIYGNLNIFGAERIRFSAFPSAKAFLFFLMVAEKFIEMGPLNDGEFFVDVAENLISLDVYDDQQIDALDRDVLVAILKAFGRLGTALAKHYQQNI